MSGWISVKDRLPEDYMNVLCAQQYTSVDCEFMVCFIINGNWTAVTENLIAYNYDGGATIEMSNDFNPTHWMPIHNPKKD